MSRGEAMKATWMVHWPGQTTPACDEHAEKLKSVAAAMGFQVSVTTCLEDLICKNCENEAKKKQV